MYMRNIHLSVNPILTIFSQYADTGSTSNELIKHSEEQVVSATEKTAKEMPPPKRQRKHPSQNTPPQCISKRKTVSLPWSKKINSVHPLGGQDSDQDKASNQFGATVTEF